MANWYVWHAAGGSGSGADWTNAYTKLRLATAAKAAGDVFFVAHDHAETEAASMTVTSPGTEVNPCRVYCVNRAGSVPPVSADLRTTATISTTGAFSISLSGAVAECYGISFQAGSSTSLANLSVGNTTSRSWRLVNCGLVLNNTNTASRLNIGAAGGSTGLEKCTVQFGSVSQSITALGRPVIRNTSTTTFMQGATLPTILISPAGSCVLYLEGIDLSNLASGKSLVLGTSATISSVMFKDCKLGASVGIVSGAVAGAGATEVTLIRCDSGDTNYRTERYNYAGNQTTETTIVRSGGATDGTTPISWKIVTSSSVGGVVFESLPIAIWNETVGSAVTVTVQGIWGGGAVPTNADIWLDVYALTTSGFPLASEVTSGRADRLTAGTNYSAGSGTWGGSTTKFAMSVTFTPQEKGPITIYVKAGVASSTFYIDPKPVIT